MKGIVNEEAIPIIVRKEIETLRRVLKFKQRGLWSRDATSAFGDDKQKSSDSKPSLSSLAPPPELTRTKDHSDYLFAELRWLAEDFKKERHWKKVSARKVQFFRILFPMFSSVLLTPFSIKAGICSA